LSRLNFVTRALRIDDVALPSVADKVSFAGRLIVPRPVTLAILVLSLSLFLPLPLFVFLLFREGVPRLATDERDERDIIDFSSVRFTSSGFRKSGEAKFARRAAASLEFRIF